MADVWELDLPQNEKMVLLKFADHADDDGLNCFPSLERIAHYSGCSLRTVQRIVRSLEERGVLEVLGGGNGRGDPRRYWVRPRKGDRLSPFSQERVTPEVEKGDTAMSPEPSVNHQNKPLSSDPADPTLELELQEQPPPAPPKALATDFEDMWEVCRRGSKKKAWAEYQKAVPAKVDAEAIHDAWVAHVEDAREEQYVAHLFRWIRDERWDEYDGDEREPERYRPTDHMRLAPPPQDEP